MKKNAPGPVSSELLAALLETSLDHMVLLDREGIILYASPAADRAMGFQAGETVGTSVFSRVHPEDLPEIQGAFERGLREPGVPVPIACRYHHQDGSWRDIEGTGVNRLGDEAVGGITLTYRDVTERRLSEAARRTGEDQYRYLVEHASDIIYVTDIQGRFTFCNPTAVRIMKCSRDELLGRHFLTLIRPDYRGLARRFYGRQVAQRIPTTYLELPAVARDGTEVWLGQNVQLVMSDAEITGVQAIARDITERLAFEERLRQAQKMEATEQLARSVAHDFNNVLTAVIGSAEFLLLQLPQGNPLRVEADAILHAGERGAALTRQLLAFSRLEKMPVEVLDLRNLVRDMDPILRRLGLDRSELLIVQGQDPVRVECDRGQLGQVLMNLVVNARDAMPDGGTITIRTASESLDEAASARLGLESRGQYARLSVADTGAGMDANTKAHLFEPYFTTKSPGKGTGLGLSIVYSIVQAGRGAIEVISEPGQGSTFHIYLPLARTS